MLNKMIIKQELLDKARFSRFKPHQQEKHYIQSIILNSIYSTINNELVFKGGTCLLFFYGLNRFSEDLDFTMIKDIDPKKLKSNITKDLENLGINHNITKIEEKDNSLSFRIGAEGPLFSKEIERCFVSIDISKREEVFESNIKEFKPVYGDVPNFTVNVMSKKEIFAEKIRALLFRNKARDLFDIHFLLKSTAPSKKMINKKLEYYDMELNKENLLKSIDKKKKIWKPEINAFIIGDTPNFENVSENVKSKLVKSLF